VAIHFVTDTEIDAADVFFYSPVDGKSTRRRED
jgi:hypothetical protein